jgi:putative DNA primase/helicase
VDLRLFEVHYLTENKEQPNIISTCNICGEPVSELRRDDANTQWYKCTNGHETSTPIKKLYDPQPYSQFESWCDPEGGFNPALFANDIVQNYEIETDVLNDVLYFYSPEKGIYDRNGDMILKRVIDDLLQKENRQHRTTETIFLCHSKTHSKIEFSKKIAIENGLLDVKTGDLTPFTPNEFVTIKIPIRYDTAAQPPQIPKFLNEVLEPDRIPIAQELFGYCLLQEYPIHTSFVLLGGGANGKSTFLNLLNAFLGPENCSHSTLQQLCEGKFELAQLYGKLANICDDLPGDALKSVGNFKNLTGNAPIQAQFKHKNPFDFLNTAKLIWACNKLPAASEDTIAYYRRFIILNFNKIFIGQKADTHLIEKLTTPGELSGMLNYALEGLARLLKNQQFTNAQSIEETRSQYIRTADSCQAFLEEMTEIVLDDDVYARDDALYSRYIAYCLFYKLPKKRKADLTISIQKNRPEAQRTHPRKGKERYWAWQYLKLKEFGTPGTSGMGVLPLAEIQNQILIKRGPPLPPVPAVPLSETPTSSASPQLEQTPADCAICLKPLPADHHDTTFYQSHEVHTACFLRMKDSEAV